MNAPPGARTNEPVAPATASEPPVPGRAPLAGVRVLELGTLIAGPYATRLLSDFGAEVIKVEAPGQGDPLRHWGAARYRGRGLWWPIQSRSKKLVTLDLRSAKGQELCRRLAGVSDAVVENFRPGTMERWNLGPDTLRADNRELIYTRVSGYGQTGPYAGRPGFAAAGEAIGGLRYLNGFPGEAPPRTGLSLGDSVTALFATVGLLIALYHRDARGGAGQVVDASIMESCFALLESVIPEFEKTGAVRQPTGTRIANNAPSNVYRSRDGKWVVIAANTDNLFRRLCLAIDRPELLADERFRDHDRRGEHADELDEIVGAWTAERDAREIDQILNDADVVCSPVYSAADIFDDPQYRAREMLVPVHDEDLGEVLGPGITPKLSSTPGRGRFDATWRPGAHNQEIYGELLGLTGDELDQLQEDGVI